MRQCAFGCVPVVHSSAVTATNSIDIHSFLVSLRQHVVFFLSLSQTILSSSFVVYFLPSASLSRHPRPCHCAKLWAVKSTCVARAAGTGCPRTPYPGQTVDIWPGRSSPQSGPFLARSLDSTEAKICLFCNFTLCFLPVLCLCVDANGRLSVLSRGTTLKVGCLAKVRSLLLVV